MEEQQKTDLSEVEEREISQEELDEVAGGTGGVGKGRDTPQH
jgi:hypothetical protein